MTRFVIPLALWIGGLAVFRWLAGLAMRRRRRVLAVIVIAVGFVCFFWPTPHIDSRGNKSIVIGAFLDIVVYGFDGGLPATAAAFGWMTLGLVVGGLIGYVFQRSGQRTDLAEAPSRTAQTNVRTGGGSHEGFPDDASLEPLLAREPCPWCKRRGLRIIRRGVREGGVESLLVRCQGCEGMTTRRVLDCNTPFFRRVWIRLSTKILSGPRGQS